MFSQVLLGRRVINGLIEVEVAEDLLEPDQILKKKIFGKWTSHVPNISSCSITDIKQRWTRLEY